jgi:hypothetical protein
MAYTYAEKITKLMEEGNFVPCAQLCSCFTLLQIHIAETILGRELPDMEVTIGNKKTHCDGKPRTSKEDIILLVAGNSGNFIRNLQFDMCFGDFFKWLMNEKIPEEDEIEWNFPERLGAKWNEFVEISNSESKSS